MDAGDRKNNENMQFLMSVGCAREVCWCVCVPELQVLCVGVSVLLLAGKVCLYVHEWEKGVRAERRGRADREEWL